MRKLVNKLILPAAVCAAFAANFATAQDVKAEEKKPDNELTFNAAVSSDYRFRGLSQSRLDPALSGGADYTHNPTGFYLGTWLSTIKWTKDLGGSGDVEIDVYGGKRGELVKNVSYDIGVLTYYYPSNHLHPQNANTTEVYGQLGYGPGYIKYSSTLTSAFGTPDSKNSGYLDIGANIDMSAGFVLNLHGGRQIIKNNSFYSYNDYKIGVTKDFGIVVGSLAFIGTDAKGGAYPTPSGKDNGKNSLVAAISKTF
jgi:uncharacterized protein (TIGR02001 family)